MPPDAVSETTALDAARTALPVPHEEASLSQKCSLLETRIAQLSEQVAHLTLVLLKERERTIERRLSDLETVVQELAVESDQIHEKLFLGTCSPHSSCRRPLSYSLDIEKEICPTGRH